MTTIYMGVTIHHQDNQQYKVNDRVFTSIMTAMNYIESIPTKTKEVSATDFFQSMGIEVVRVK